MMPILDLFKNGQLKADAGVQTLSVMFWPHSIKPEHVARRQEFHLVIKHFLATDMSEEIPLTATYKAANKRWKTGCQAGHFLHSIFDCSRSSRDDERQLASKSAIQKAWSNPVNIFGEADNLYIDEATARRYWRDFQPSLHLWAALLEHYKHEIPGVWDGWVPGPQELQDLWAIAYNAAAWASQFSPKGKGGPTLDPNDLWMPPPNSDPRT